MFLLIVVECLSVVCPAVSRQMTNKALLVATTRINRSNQAWAHSRVLIVMKGLAHRAALVIRQDLDLCRFL